MPDNFTMVSIVSKDVLKHNTGRIFKIWKKEQIFWEHLLGAKLLYVYYFVFVLQHTFQVFIFLPIFK